jgi:hypothetical protein
MTEPTAKQQVERSVTARGKRLLRRPWFWLVLVVLVLPVLAGGVLIVWFLADDPLGPESESIDCAVAARDAGFETLPVAGATCAAGGFQDPFVTIDFVAPRTDVDAWLRSELPGTELRPEPCVDTDECVQVGPGDPDAPESGWYLDLGIVEQDGGNVAVRIMAYSM